MPENPNDSLQRSSSMLRSLEYFLRRWVLRSQFLLARVPALGLRFRVKAEDVVGRHLFKYQVHEPELSTFIAENLRCKSGDILLDIGANVGWYTLLFSKIAPKDVQILAFEPDPLNYDLLTKNLAINRAERVDASRIALADSEGTQKLHRYSNRNLGRHSLLPINNGPTINVKTKTLDGLLEERNLGERVPCLIKIDVEGYELRVLRGAEKTLKRCRMLVCEHSPETMRQSGEDPRELLDLLDRHGFLPHRVGPSGLTDLHLADLAADNDLTEIVWIRRDADISPNA